MIRAIWLGLFVTSIAARAGQLPFDVRFLPGPVNGLLVADRVLIYGNAADRVRKVPYVLFTEGRRDVVWAGAPLVARGAAAIVPEQSVPCSKIQGPSGRHTRRNAFMITRR